MANANSNRNASAIVVIGYISSIGTARIADFASPQITKPRIWHSEVGCWEMKMPRRMDGDGAYDLRLFFDNLIRRELAEFCGLNF